MYYPPTKAFDRESIATAIDGEALMYNLSFLGSARKMLYSNASCDVGVKIVPDLDSGIDLLAGV